MTNNKLKQGSLILYKNRLGFIRQVDKKIEIEVAGGQSYSVRPKDIALLHPGPVQSLASLVTPQGEIKIAWELLAGTTTNLAELAELAYGDYTPATAWAAWQWVADGLYFQGEPEAITVQTAAAVAQEQETRRLKAAREQAWNDFLARIEAGRYLPEDEENLADVVALAEGQGEQSRVLKVLGHGETPQNAHTFLLNLGYWDEQVNPYPVRQGVTRQAPAVLLPDLPDEPRRDLTHLTALAIDDEGNQDPDDALSWADGRLWVHIADVAALAPVDSPADLEARTRGATLYLPEGAVPMLPPAAAERLGLGLSEVSPALSFGLEITAGGEVVAAEIVPSWVRVTRLSYDEAESRLDEPLLSDLYRLARHYEAQRRQNGAIHIDLPEVKVNVTAGRVEIRPLPALRSRDLVREAMLMTGEAVARFALDNDLAVPFTAQEGPDLEDVELPGQGAAAMFALRRMMKRSQAQSSPGPHAGLGMDLYVQTTSPLRRYLDLVTHQQLRRFLRGEPVLDQAAVMARVGAAEAVTGSVRRAERYSINHWTLVYLLQNPDWQGDGIIIDKRGRRDVILIPELALEVQLYQNKDLPLDSVVRLQLVEVDLPNLEAHFRV